MLFRSVSQSRYCNYRDQIKAHFGVNVPASDSHMAQYIGGIARNLDISEVVNNNLQGDGEAVIYGKGVGSQSGHTLTYDCGAEHQVIMCVYHAVPMVDWNLTGQNPQLTVTAITDFPQPAFDQLGRQAVPGLNLHNNPSRSVSTALG